MLEDAMTGIAGAALAGATILSAMLSVLPAFAQTQQQIERCEDKGDAFPPDQEISGCTAVIQSGKWSGQPLSWAFANRCDAYNNKRDYDHALPDCNEAIRLDPKSPGAFTNLGDAYYGKKDYSHAIADYSQAMRLAPGNAVPVHDRGNAYFVTGNFTAAAADLLGANQLAERPYATLWRFLALGHLAQDGATELRGNAARLTTRNWPYPVIEYYLGDRTLAHMRAAAGNPDDKCEAEFYAGEWQLVHGNSSDARAALQTAVDTCPTYFNEYDAALAELKRLKP
jgi:lipoprotein NlpI